MRLSLADRGTAPSSARKTADLPCIDIGRRGHDDDYMQRSIVLALLVLALPHPAAVQALSVLHIKVVVADAAGTATPVSRHALLVSDNPSSAPPRRVVTGIDGTVSLPVPPGNYTIESDRPVTIGGKTYEWTQTIDVVAGRDATVELTGANAEAAPTGAGAAPADADPSVLLSQWEESVVAIWTPTAHASATLIDTNGLMATNQRVVGAAKSVEVQVSPAVKVTGLVLAADAARDVAVLWIDPKLTAPMKPVPLVCPPPARPEMVEKQAIFTIVRPLRDRKGVISGEIERVEPQAVVADFGFSTGSSGGPVFTASGAVLGINSARDAVGDSGDGDARVVRIEQVCEVVADARKKMKDAASPPATHLPIEPERPFPADALKDAVQHRAGSLLPYQISSSDFDIALITPVLVYGAQYQLEQASERERATRTRTSEPDPPFVRPLLEFSNWSEYVRDVPPVLLVRATPKFVEGFWTKVARGAAQTQGVSLPPIKRFKSGFSRMRAFCGDAEVTPIHPFRLEQRIGDGDAIYEGLYVFDPGALRPDCGGVKLVLYSEKEPQKADTKVVDAAIVEQIWQDFAPYRVLH
jgi:S1-C subfamily serine protease